MGDFGHKKARGLNNRQLLPLQLWIGNALINFPNVCKIPAEHSSVGNQLFGMHGHYICAVFVIGFANSKGYAAKRLHALPRYIIDEVGKQ